MGSTFSTAISVHVTDEVRKALLQRGYLLIVIGGGITGDVQVNDTHMHHRLKKANREQESQLMLFQLRENPQKIPQSSRDIMRMPSDSWQSLNVDTCKALKNNFVPNALDGS